MSILSRRSPAFICVALVALSSCGGSGEPTTSPGNKPLTSGGILYGASRGGGVAAYAINASSGVLTPIAGSPFAPEASEPAAFAMWLSANPARSVVYLAVASTNIESWSANPTTGVPAATSGAPFAIALNGRIAVSPDGNHVYAPTGTGLATYSVGADGTLAAVDARSDSPGAGAAAAVTPDGRFVYLASGPDQSRISTFSVSSATGALSPLAVNTLAPSDTAFPGDAGMAISPNGQFLYLSSRSTQGRIEAYTIASSTGGLSPVNGSPFASPASPKELILDPSGKFLFAATGSGVAAYAVDAASGALTAVAGSPFGSSGMAHLVVDASGHFLYATYLSSPIAAYTIDQKTGALSAIAGGPFGAGTGDLAILK
ncbi:MAG TPA: beta-propeller fold lactonase family protein [Gemmatimonadaceae bacterium]|nr:beta-propeller fold lactonase family protein [Gemmatimonadaceae bacterium]